MIAGLFPIVTSEGVPLDVLLAGMQSRGLTPDWVDFFGEARRFGWNVEATLTRVELAVQDAIGPEVAEIVVSRLSALTRAGVFESTPSRPEGGDIADENR